MPVLIQATPDTPWRMTIRDRRDSFCGKMSACNNLMQYGIPYSLTTLHTETPRIRYFKKDLAWFPGVCNVVRGMRQSADRRHWRAPRGLQYRPLQRKTARGSGISVEPIDLSEILGRIDSHERRSSGRAEQAVIHQKLMFLLTTSRSGVHENGKTGRGDRRLDGRNGSSHQRCAVLDIPRRVFRRGALHGDEHDERRS